MAKIRFTHRDSCALGIIKFVLGVWEMVKRHGDGDIVGASDPSNFVERRAGERSRMISCV